VAALVGELGDVGLKEARLVGVLSQDGLRHVNENTAILLGFDSVVFGRPADTDVVAGFGRGHSAPLAAVRLGDGVLSGLIRTGFPTMSAVGARSKVAGVLLVMAVRRVFVEAAECDLRGDGVLTSPAKALAAACGKVCKHIKNKNKKCTNC